MPYSLVPASELSRDGGSGSLVGNVRRITPVPLSATSPLPEVGDSRPAPAPGAPPAAAAAAAPAERKAAAAAPAPAAKFGGGFDIARLALEAGKKAALQGKGKQQ